MGRRRKGGHLRRVQLRLSDRGVGLFDGYTPDQLSELMERALLSMSPGIEMGDSMISVVRPADPISRLIVRIFVKQKQIQLLYPDKCDVFRDVVKSLDYVWSAPYWLKTVEPEARVDRAAEVAHRLLLSRFCVQIESEAIKDKVVAASYEPEHYRKIDAAQQHPWTGWFKIQWPRAEDLYDKAKAITGARYSEGAIYVPAECFADVRDFADIHDFWLTHEAEMLMSKAEQAWDEVAILSPEIYHKRQRKARAKQPQSVSSEIPDELRDDD